MYSVGRHPETHQSRVSVRMLVKVACFMDVCVLAKHGICRACLHDAHTGGTCRSRSIGIAHVSSDVAALFPEALLGFLVCESLCVAMSCPMRLFTSANCLGHISQDFGKLFLDRIAWFHLPWPGFSTALLAFRASLLRAATGR